MSVGQSLIFVMATDVPPQRAMPIPPPSRVSAVASCQELTQDVAPACADGQAHADLAGSFRHAHQHDVHDADAADDQRDRPDGGQ